jgi:hypothetical protein
MSRLRRRPSPALVVGCIALCVALGGTGYAAIRLPANSVGTAQLKNGAVVAAKVKSRSLLATHFVRGQLPAGPPGPKGADGLAGSAGPAGPAGPKGDPATRLFATVKRQADGTGVDLGPSSGVVGQPAKVGSGSGKYNLTFNQDVSGCAVLATPGGKNLLEGQLASVNAVTTGGAGVTVQMFDDNGPADLDFFTVALFC